jgi:hypothetical protein
MQPEYTTVIDPLTIIPTAIAMGIHVVIALVQAGLAIFMIASGVDAALRPQAKSTMLRRLLRVTPRGASGSRAFAVLWVVFGLLLALPLLVGASSLVSLLAGVGALAMLLLGARAIPIGAEQPGRWARRVAIVAIAAVALFMIWEGEDGLALGVGLTTNMREWRTHEVEWQLRTDAAAPKVGDLAPDFELQDPRGVTAVRLSDFRDKRPVVLVFGSYT